ncbi:hypothetical protein KF840_12595 [bacterium]|nr:hypothetical protein [bacterium]
MARVWFVRRRGGQWIAPGGAPAHEIPFADLIFPLDIGTHRAVSDERPVPAPDEPAALPEGLQRVFVEVDAHDLEGLTFTGYRPGVYDSPYSPSEVARRLARSRRPARSAA